MIGNRAIIPLYMNADMLNNLFTVVIQEYVEAKTISKKDAINIHLKTPISELSYDLFGRYMQGELEIQIQKEFTKQRTEQSISILIVILKQLKDILLAQGLLKSFTDNNANGANIDDYVEFPCRLRRNPIVQNVINTINMLQLSGAINANQDEVSLDSLPVGSDVVSLIKRDELINYLKNSLDEHKKERCIRYIAESIDNPNDKYIVPIKTSSLVDNEDYLLNSKVTILGKVVSRDSENDIFSVGEEGGNDYSPIYNDAFFDYIDFNKIKKLHCPFLRTGPHFKDVNKLNSIKPLYEILPLAIYI